MKKIFLSVIAAALLAAGCTPDQPPAQNTQSTQSPPPAPSPAPPTGGSGY